MKIKELQIFAHDLPIKDGLHKMANAEVWTLDTTPVKFVTDTGLVGWSETGPVRPTYQLRLTGVGLGLGLGETRGTKGVGA